MNRLREKFESLANDLDGTLSSEFGRFCEELCRFADDASGQDLWKVQQAICRAKITE